MSSCFITHPSANMNTTLNFSGRRKTPLILQTEAAECGLACLAMVAGAHGYRTDLVTLRGKYLISLKGTTLNHLISIAAQLNLNSRPLRLEMEALSRLRLPAILHWDLNHFVVLIEVKRRKAVILDPNVGRRTLSLSELSKHFTGVALELTPNEKFKRKTEISRISIRQLIGRMPGLGRTLSQLFLLAVVVEVFAIASPLFMQLVLDHAVIAGDRDLLTVLGLGFLLLTLIKVGVTALRAWVALYLNTTLNLQMLSRLFSHLLQLPMAYFSRRHLGDITSRFDSLSTIRRTVTTTFLGGHARWHYGDGDGGHDVSLQLEAVAHRPRGNVALRRAPRGAIRAAARMLPKIKSSAPPGRKLISSKPCAACKA